MCIPPICIVWFFYEGTHSQFCDMITITQFLIFYFLVDFCSLVTCLCVWQVVNGVVQTPGDQDTEDTELMAIYAKDSQTEDKVSSHIHLSAERVL